MKKSTCVSVDEWRSRLLGEEQFWMADAANAGLRADIQSLSNLLDACQAHAKDLSQCDEQKYHDFLDLVIGRRTLQVELFVSSSTEESKSVKVNGMTLQRVIGLCLAFDPAMRTGYGPGQYGISHIAIPFYISGWPFKALIDEEVLLMQRAKRFWSEERSIFTDPQLYGLSVFVSEIASRLNNNQWVDALGLDQDQWVELRSPRLNSRPLPLKNEKLIHPLDLAILNGNFLGAKTILDKLLSFDVGYLNTARSTAQFVIDDEFVRLKFGSALLEPSEASWPGADFNGPSLCLDVLDSLQRSCHSVLGDALRVAVCTRVLLDAGFDDRSKISSAVSQGLINPASGCSNLAMSVQNLVSDGGHQKLLREFLASTLSRQLPDFMMACEPYFRSQLKLSAHDEAASFHPWLNLAANIDNKVPVSRVLDCVRILTGWGLDINAKLPYDIEHDDLMFRQHFGLMHIAAKGRYGFVVELIQEFSRMGGDIELEDRMGSKAENFLSKAQREQWHHHLNVIAAVQAAEQAIASMTDELKPQKSRP